jgi:general secretion pathway protein G
VKRVLRLNEKGMTLIELMITIAIIGGLITVLAVNVFSQFGRARVKEAGMQLENLRNSLMSYDMDCRGFPPEDAGLHALIQNPGEVCPNWSGPYADPRLMRDPFGRDLIYERTETGFKLTFLGKDGKPGGSELNKDISIEESER